MNDLSTHLIHALNCLKEPLFILDDTYSCVFANKALYTFLGVKPVENSTLKVENFWPDCGQICGSENEISCEFRVPR
jgi:PAS domain-containing protein